MTTSISAVSAVALLIAFGIATAMAAPIPAFTFPQENTYELAAADKARSRIETTKAWLRMKKTQTTRWMGRQKQTLKRLAD